MLEITLEDPASAAAEMVIAELSATLARITGDSGRSSFDPGDVRGPKACFVVARDGEGQAIGCGGLRPLEANIAEVKRMYARRRCSDPEASRSGSARLRLPRDLAGDAARQCACRRILRAARLSADSQFRQICRPA